MKDKVAHGHDAAPLNIRMGGSRFIGQALGRLGYYLEIAQNRVLGLGVG